MQLLRLAQFYKAEDLSQDQKWQLARKIDTNYYIPNNTYRDLREKSFLGYNCLHIAAMKLYSDFVHDFVNRGADVLKQGTQNGKTPLHIAVDVKSTFKGKKIWEISGKLQDCQMVNTLLLAHVKSNNSFNPKCHNDMSHFHIACMFNCVEAVQFFLKNGEPFNQVTKADAHWPSYASLHFAIRYSSVETAEILLSNGADIFAKDAEGISSLHLLINRLLNIADYFNMGQCAFYVPYEEELKRLETIVSIVLKLEGGDGGNFVDETGLTIVHLACILRDTSIAEIFLSGSLDLNTPVKDDSKFWPGWTLLHFAACSSVETVKLLMRKGADITIKNKRGGTPLDMCLKRYAPHIVHSILSIKDDFKRILLTDLTDTLLDLILAMNDMKSFDNYSEQLTEPDICVFPISPLLPAYSLLHLALSMNERTKSWNDFVAETDWQENVDSLPKNYNCTEEESSVYFDRIEACLKRGCSITFKNFDGSTPIHLAFKSHNFNLPLLAKLFSHCAEDASDPDNFSHLHIACATGNHKAVQALLDAGADINATTTKSFEWYNKPYHCPGKVKPHSIPVNANSTPLHVAVAFEHADIVKILLEKGANVHAVDSEGFTPIHLSIAQSNGSNDIAEIIVSRSGKLIDLVSKEGLSHLHVVAFVGDAGVIKKLLDNGANVNRSIDVLVPDFLSRFAGKTPLQVLTQTAATQISREELALAVKVLIESGADIYVNDTLQCLMGEADVDFSEYLVDRLKLNENVRGPIDSSGLTLLHVACSRFDVDWATELLDKGADVNARIRSDDDYRGRWKGYTPLHALVLRKNPANALIRRAVYKFGTLLLDRGADVTIDSVDGTPLHLAYCAYMKNSQEPDMVPEHNIPLFGAQGPVWRLDFLTTHILKSQKSYQINPTNADGLSHFHLFCMLDRTASKVKHYLDKGVDVNHSTNPFSDDYPGCTGIHFAFARGAFDVGDILLNHRANVEIENANGNTPLHHMILQNLTNDQTDYIPPLRRRWGTFANFEAKNILGQTPIDILLNKRNFRLEEFRYLLEMGSSISFQSSSSSPGPAALIMKNSAKDEQVQIFKKFVSAGGVRSAVKYGGYDPISEVITAQMSVSENQVFIDAVQQLVDIGCEIHRPYDKGDTGLHKSILAESAVAVNLWLRLGADVNSCDLDSRMFEPDYYNAIEQLLACHVRIMKVLGLYVSRPCNSIYNSFAKKFPMLVADADYGIKVELEKAKSVKVTESLTASTFVSELWAVSRYPRLPVKQREDIDAFFKRITYLHKEFPTLCGLMMLQYKKALVRSELLESAEEVLQTECNVYLPYLCMELLLSYLSNDELKYLVKDSKEMENPYKRPRIE